MSKGDIERGGESQSGLVQARVGKKAVRGRESDIKKIRSLANQIRTQ